VSIAVPSQKQSKWDSKSKQGYMVGYDTYSTSYLIWYPELRHLEKARNIFFHEEVITPAKPVLYGDDSLLATSDEKSAMAKSAMPLLCSNHASA
jgi:hypothetical protein